MKLIRFHNPNDAMANGYVVANFGELPTCRYYGLSFKLPTRESVKWMECELSNNISIMVAKIDDVMKVAKHVKYDMYPSSYREFKD